MLGWLKKTKLHFVGIGGIGMSGIAEILLDLGYFISGSDLNHSLVIERLREKGAEIFLGHHEDHLSDATLVVYSSAIDHKNPEIQKALRLGIPMIQRAEMLAELMRLKFGIAIAGSHGKTTTTSVLATIFNESQLDATYVVGGIVSNLGGNAKRGKGDYLIAEADESDGSFLLLSPIMAAITNVDNDHLDHYGTKEQIIDAFLTFVHKLPFYGTIALNANDKTSVELRPKIKRNIIWFGLEYQDHQQKMIPYIETDYLAKNFQLSASLTRFDLFYKDEFIQQIQTNLLGLHNISNCLTSIVLAREVGLSWEIIQNGLQSFKGVGRRLEKIYEKDNFVVIDDYAHHPTEIKATLTSLKKLDNRRMCIIFEPHRYTRLESFWTEFQEALDVGEDVYVGPIYAASESPIQGIDSQTLVDHMKTKGIQAHLMKSLDDMETLLHEKMREEIIFVTLGAGLISKKMRKFVARL